MASRRGHKWQGSVTVGGRRYRRDGFDTQEDAMLWEMQTRKSVKTTGKAPARASRASLRSARLTLPQLLDKTLEARWRGLASEENNVRNAERAIKFFGDRAYVDEITTDDIDAWAAQLEQEGASGSTVNRKLSTLSTMLTFAHERGALASKPVFHKKREGTHRIRWITAEEEEKLLPTLRSIEADDVADFVAFSLDTGLRTGEAMQLQWQDVEAEWIRVWQTKTDKPRSVPCTKRVREIINRRRGLCKPFEGVTKSSLRQQWNNAKRLMGLSDDEQFIPYACRHTFASRLVQRGVDLSVVRDLMGHTTIQTTLRYAHLAPKNYADAVALLEA